MTEISGKSESETVFSRSCWPKLPSTIVSGHMSGDHIVAGKQLGAGSNCAVKNKSVVPKKVIDWRIFLN